MGNVWTNAQNAVIDAMVGRFDEITEKLKQLPEQGDLGTVWDKLQELAASLTTVSGRVELLEKNLIPGLQYGQAKQREMIDELFRRPVESDHLSADSQRLHSIIKAQQEELIKLRSSSSQAAEIERLNVEASRLRLELQARVDGNNQLRLKRQEDGGFRDALARRIQGLEVRLQNAKYDVSDLVRILDKVCTADAQTATDWLKARDEGRDLLHNLAERAKKEDGR